VCVCVCVYVCVCVDVGTIYGFDIEIINQYSLWIIFLFFQIYDLKVLTKIHWTCIILIGCH